MGVKKSSVIVILAALLMCMLPWLFLTHGNGAKVGNHPLFPFGVAFFALLPLYPLYKLVKQWPRFRVGIIVIAANTLLCVVLALLYYGLDVDNIWMDRMFDVSQVLLLGGCLLLVWQGVRYRRQ
jgi:hypothetical protein